MIREKEKRGQVTIFIIVGIVIVVGIIISFYFMGSYSVDSSEGLNPKDFVEKCVRETVEESVEEIMAGGGEVYPEFTVSYLGKNWSYLCYQENYYDECYNLHPMLERQVENEIFEDTRESVGKCFGSMKKEFEDRKFDVSYDENIDYSIDLVSGSVDVLLSTRVEVSKDGITSTFKNFDTKIISSIYELVSITRDIINDESQYCSFDYNSYMFLYPKYNIQRIDYSENNLYRVIHRRTGEEFRFAVRGCVLPAGML